MNDLETTSPNQDELAAYLGALTNNEDVELAELRAEANPFSVMARLILSKKTKEISAVLGDETVATFGSRNPLIFVPILIAERRALWSPENRDDVNSPVCSTPHVKIGTFRRDADNGIGEWRVKDNPGLQPPFKVYDDEEVISQKHHCHDCPWNVFGSMPEWDSSREGKGKACGEGRLLVGYLAEAVPNGQLPGGMKVFNYDPSGPMVYMNVPATSIKTVKAIGNACLGRNIPARYCAFQLGNTPQKNGTIEWGELTAELHGFVNRHLIAESDKASKNMREMVFIKQNAEKIIDRVEAPPAHEGTDVPF